MQDISSVGVAVTPTYFWVRIFDYDPERDGREKGTLLEEYYLDNAATCEQAKTLVQTRYGAAPLKWAKPQKGPGVYVLVMESTRFFYDRFYTTIDPLFLVPRPDCRSCPRVPATYAGRHRLWARHSLFLHV